MSTLTIASRFMGPAGSGNGGYVCGRLAQHAGAGGDVTRVSLRRPPPLDRALSVRQHAGGASLNDAADLVAEGGPGDFADGPVPPVSWEQARDAEPSYQGLVHHPFPTCFVCGTAREPGDALCLRPGRHAPGRTACAWVPDPRLGNPDGLVAPEVVWSALDCPGGWTSDLELRPLVLATMTACLLEPVAAGDKHVVVGQLLAEQGRKTFTTSALYDTTGRLLARAEQVWIAVDPDVFQQLTS
ncbi:MAG: hypothetical protein ACR2FP_04465 [Nocardioidaceae bacterium]